MLSFFATVPIVIGIIMFILPLKKTARFFAAAAQIALFGFAYYVFLMCKGGEIITRVGNYEGFMGIVLKADTMTSVFLMLTSFIFLIIAIYSFNDNFSRLFWFFMFVWEGLLNGIFMSNDMFNIFVLMEVATVVVAVMIMFTRDNRSMYDGMVYLMVNLVAMQFYLFGVGYIYKLTGTLDKDAVTQALRLLDKSSLILPYALIMTAISLKCALTPLFTWLPKAHGTPSAPSSVSAILSGLHIKCSVYLFIRFQDIFADVMVNEFFLAIGIVTGFAGALLALSQTDIKLILAYSTISQVGMIMVGLNLSEVHSYTGSVYHIFNHSLFKSSLLLCAGIIKNAYGTRDIREIRGVMKRYPLVGAAILMSVLGITGTPFFNGSISKYFITSGAGMAVEAMLVLINLGTILVFIKFSSMLFGMNTGDKIAQGDGSFASALSTQENRPPVHHPVDKFQQTAVLILGALCLAGGVFGEQFIEYLFNVKVSIDRVGYLEKTVLFVLSVIAGYFIVKYFVNRHTFFKHVRGFDISFRLTCAYIGGFFALTLVVARLFAV